MAIDMTRNRTKKAGGGHARVTVTVVVNETASLPGNDTTWIGVQSNPTSPPASEVVLGIRLRDFSSSRGGSIPIPLAQTPIFEDLTFTIIHERPVVLFAEAGVSE